MPILTGPSPVTTAVSTLPAALPVTAAVATPNLDALLASALAKAPPTEVSLEAAEAGRCACSAGDDNPY